MKIRQTAEVRRSETTNGDSANRVEQSINIGYMHAPITPIENGREYERREDTVNTSDGQSRVHKRDLHTAENGRHSQEEDMNAIKIEMGPDIVPCTLELLQRDKTGDLPAIGAG